MPDAPPAILLLESDAVTEELYKRELGRHFRVFTGRDEDAALLLLDTADIRAIVLEPAWANGGGWHFLATLKQMFQPPHIPVVICSVLDERRTGYRMGVAAYCVKPVLPTTLLASLNQVLQN